MPILTSIAEPLPDPTLATAPGRRAREDELETAIEAWTRTRAPDAAMADLQAEGIAAGVARGLRETMFEEPQLEARAVRLRDLVQTNAEPVDPRAGLEAQPRRGDQLGRRTRNLLPRPSALSTSIRARCARAMCFAIARPSPDPSRERERRSSIR